MPLVVNSLGVGHTHTRGVGTTGAREAQAPLTF